MLVLVLVLVLVLQRAQDRPSRVGGGGGNAMRPARAAVGEVRCRGRSLFAGVVAGVGCDRRGRGRGHGSRGGHGGRVAGRWSLIALVIAMASELGTPSQAKSAAGL